MSNPIESIARPIKHILHRQELGTSRNTLHEARERANLLPDGAARNLAVAKAILTRRQDQDGTFHSLRSQRRVAEATAQVAIAQAEQTQDQQLHPQNQPAPNAEEQAVITSTFDVARATALQTYAAAKRDRIFRHGPGHHFASRKVIRADYGRAVANAALTRDEEIATGTDPQTARQAYDTAVTTAMERRKQALAPLNRRARTTVVTLGLAGAIFTGGTGYLAESHAQLIPSQSQTEGQPGSQTSVLEYQKLMSADPQTMAQDFGGDAANWHYNTANGSWRYEGTFSPTNGVLRIPHGSLVILQDNNGYNLYVVGGEKGTTVDEASITSFTMFSIPWVEQNASNLGVTDSDEAGYGSWTYSTDHKNIAAPFVSISGPDAQVPSNFQPVGKQ